MSTFWALHPTNTAGARLGDAGANGTGGSYGVADRRLCVLGQALRCRRRCAGGFLERAGDRPERNPCRVGRSSAVDLPRAIRYLTSLKILTFFAISQTYRRLKRGTMNVIFHTRRILQP